MTPKYIELSVAKSQEEVVHLFTSEHNIKTFRELQYNWMLTDEEKNKHPRSDEFVKAVLDYGEAFTKIYEILGIDFK